MKQFSVVLTKINTEPIPFKRLATMTKQSPTINLVTFVRYMHPKDDILEEVECIKVFTKKNAYAYYNYGTHFQRLDLNTQSKKFYKVS